MYFYGMVVLQHRAAHMNMHFYALHQNVCALILNNILIDAWAAACIYKIKPYHHDYKYYDRGRAGSVIVKKFIIIYLQVYVKVILLYNAQCTAHTYRNIYSFFFSSVTYQQLYIKHNLPILCTHLQVHINSPIVIILKNARMKKKNEKNNVKQTFFVIYQRKKKKITKHFINVKNYKYTRLCLSCARARSQHCQINVSTPIYRIGD